MSGTYNGWTNYETWNVMLWLDNDETLYRAYRTLRPLLKDGRVTAGHAERFVRDSIPNGTPDLDDRWKSEMGGTSKDDVYECVDWQAIADAMNDE